MNNEPVAWTNDRELTRETPTKLMFRDKGVAAPIPLYTHPVKELGNPVAWRSQSPDGYWSVYQAPVEGAEPLYTGFNELTDEYIEKNTDYWADKANWIKKNEPVAWMDEINTFVLDIDYKQFPKSLQNGMIPLYTHPVKELTMTDDQVEEFEWALKKHFNFPTSEKVPNLDRIIRAILRKASEKC